MATLTAQAINHTGVDGPANLTAAASGGDQFLNDGRMFIYVENGDASSHTPTVNSQSACDQGSDHDIAPAIPAGEGLMFGPFPPARFNDSSGYVQITYDAVTSVTIGIFQLVANP